MSKQFCVYIMGSGRPTLYIGVTSNLPKRIFEHQHGLMEGFSEKYQTHKLLYVEWHDSAEEAIKREKQMKKWKREWKLRLIQKTNPGLSDLSTCISH